jgi:hypothetical protein
MITRDAVDARSAEIDHASWVAHMRSPSPVDKDLLRAAAPKLAPPNVGPAGFRADSQKRSSRLGQVRSLDRSKYLRLTVVRIMIDELTGK